MEPISSSDAAQKKMRNKLGLDKSVGIATLVAVLMTTPMTFWLAIPFQLIASVFVLGLAVKHIRTTGVRERGIDTNILLPVTVLMTPACIGIIANAFEIHGTSAIAITCVVVIAIWLSLNLLSVQVVKRLAV